MVSLIPRKRDEILAVESRWGQNLGSAQFSKCHACLFFGIPAPAGGPDPLTVCQFSGGIAQLVERQLCKLDVRGSSPRASTKL